MTSIERFHQLLRTESALFVADAASMGFPVAAATLRRGVEILEARLAQIPAVGPVPLGRGAAAASGSAILELAPPPRSRVNPLDLVDDVVAATFGVEVGFLHLRRREQRVSWARHVAMYVARRVTDASFPEIARHFGLRDHSTAIYGCEQTQDRVALGKLQINLDDLCARAADELRAADLPTIFRRPAAPSAA